MVKLLWHSLYLLWFIIYGMNVTLIPSTGTPPVQKYEWASVYDEKEHRIITFGGYDNTNNEFLSDLYYFDLNSLEWYYIISSSSEVPKGRFSSYMYLRSDRVLLIFFGQRYDGITSDVFSFDLTTHSWKLESLTGDKVAERCNFGADYFTNNQNETFVAFYGGITQSEISSDLFL